MRGFPVFVKKHRSFLRFLAPVFIAAAFGWLAPDTRAGPLYQWRDEAGIRHFSDAPPPHSQAKPLGEPAGPGETPSEPASRRTDAITVLPEAAGVFWKVEKPGVSPSFLLGTIHVEDERVVKLPPAVEKAFDASRFLVLELILDESAVVKAALSMLYMDGTDLKDVLGETLFNRAARAMNVYGVPEIALRRMKPWAVMSLLTVPRPKTGDFLDLVLYRRAVQSGKKVFGLESVEEQVGALESLSLRDQVEILRQTLDQMDLIPRLQGAMIETYLAGDLEGLVSLSKRFVRAQDRELADRFMASLNEARNLKMAERLKPYIAKGNAFAAVGALHLPGEKGLLNLLKKSGHEVSPYP